VRRWATAVCRIHNIPFIAERRLTLILCSFLYALFLAVDGNFKLKGKHRKLEDIDFLGATGAFVDEVPFQEHIANYVDQPEVRYLTPYIFLFLS